MIHDPEHPSVVEDDEGEPYAYQMWYTGYSCGSNCGWAGAIGYVVSHDGKNWVRPPEVREQPVLTRGGPGDWDSSFVHIPSVHYDADEDLYRMWYSGGPNIGLATSKDGMKWEKHPGPLQLRRGSETSTINCDVLHNGTHYEMWFSVRDAGRWDIQYARSLDGIIWTRPPNSKVVIPSGGAWDDEGTCNPKVHFDGVSYRVWYTGDCRGTYDDSSWVTGMATFEAELPRPHFRTDPEDDLLEGQTVTFDASGSNSPVVPDPQPGDFSYSWDFGDGNTGDGVKVEHAYASPRDYRVRLTFHDGQQSASIERILRVDFRLEPRFLRGDGNADGTVDIADPIANLGFRFVGNFDPPCRDALDFDDNGIIDVSDPIASLSHQFLGGSAPAPPGKSTCGADPTDDELTCDSFEACAAGG